MRFMRYEGNEVDVAKMTIEMSVKYPERLLRFSCIDPNFPGNDGKLRKDACMGCIRIHFVIV